MLEHASSHIGRHRWITTFTLAACVAMSGCSKPANEPVPAKQIAQTPAESKPTVGGDGSEIRLDALTSEDVATAGIYGELACSFSAGGPQPILLAMGAVDSDDPAQGVVKVAGYVERVASPGGYDGMLDAAVFTGKGKTVKVDVTGESIGEGESPPRPATLTYMRADGASRSFDGFWQCGP